MTNINDLMESSQAHKWEDNPLCKGRVVKVEKKQATSPDGTPKVFPSGDPMMEWVLTLQVAPPTDEDDGQRTIYAKGGKYEPAEGEGDAMLVAIFGAYKKAGISEVEGADLTVKNTGTAKPLAKGQNGARLFKAKAEAAKTAIADDDL